MRFSKNKLEMAKVPVERYTRGHSYALKWAPKKVRNGRPTQWKAIALPGGVKAKIKEKIYESEDYVDFQHTLIIKTKENDTVKLSIDAIDMEDTLDSAWMALEVFLVPYLSERDDHTDGKIAVYMERVKRGMVREMTDKFINRKISPDGDQSLLDAVLKEGNQQLRKQSEGLNLH